MRELANPYPRCGYRRVRILLTPRGHAMSADCAHRLSREAGLQVSHRPRRLPPTGPNGVCAHDLMCETCAGGATQKRLTVVDEFSRECSEIDVAGGIRSRRVTDVPTQLVRVHGPGRAERDGVHRSGPAPAEWHRRMVPGKVPRRRLDLEWLPDWREAKVEIEIWRRH